MKTSSQVAWRPFSTFQLWNGIKSALMKDKLAETSNLWALKKTGGHGEIRSDRGASL